MFKKAREIIGDIIKSNIKESNYTNKEVSILTGINEINLSNLINGKEAISFENSRKLSFVFDNFKEKPSYLFNIFNELKEIELIRKNNNEELEIANSISKLKLYDDISKIKIIKKNIDGCSFAHFQKFILNSSISFSKYLNKLKPIAKLWFILMYKKYKNIKNEGSFKKSTSKTVYKKILEIFFQKFSLNKRIRKIEEELFKRGIILKNGPYINLSLIKGVSFKKFKTRFIFLSDMHKREFRWIIALIHELAHFYEDIDNEKKIDFFAIKKIKNFLKKNDIKNNDFKVFFSLYDNNKNKYISNSQDEYFKELHEKTKSKINFGDQKEFINSLII